VSCSLDKSSHIIVASPIYYSSGHLLQYLKMQWNPKLAFCVSYLKVVHSEILVALFW